MKKGIYLGKNNDNKPVILTNWEKSTNTNHLITGTAGAGRGFKVPRVVIPENKEKIESQIYALKYAISQDTNPKDKEIHELALKDLESSLKDI